MTDEQERVQPSGVWATAVGVARVRVLETQRENALFRDPLAQAFATAGGLWPSSPPLPDDEAARRRRLAVSFSIVIRTKFLDDLLRQASASGVRQVVLLGAGMDSRAFRMDWPEGTRLFEVDTAEPLDFKASVLRRERAVARCERITVAVDLHEDWPGALAAAGHDPALPTAWIAEGLLIYLPEDAVELLMARISTRSAAGSRMGLTLGSRGVIERFGADAAPGSAASLWISEMPDDPVGWLAGHGWEADSHTLRERAAAYGRPIGTPPQPEERPGGLISAVRRGSDGGARAASDNVRPAVGDAPGRIHARSARSVQTAQRGLPFSTWSLTRLADFLVAEGGVDDISHEGLRGSAA